MGDNGPPAKKRGASRQISKDDDSSDSEGPVTNPLESGSFPKASEEVLASRRIVKVRRGSNPPASSAPNPFASIRLVAPTPLENKPSVSIPTVNPPTSVLTTEDVKLAAANDAAKPLVGTVQDNAKVAEGDLSEEKHHDKSLPKDGVENNAPVADVVLKEGGEKNGNNNGIGTNGVYNKEPQQVLVPPEDQIKGKDEEDKAQANDNMGNNDEVKGQGEENKGEDEESKGKGEESKGEGEESKGEGEESKGEGEESKEGTKVGQDDSSKIIIEKDVLEGSGDLAKSSLLKGPFSFGTGPSSAETPPTGFAVFSSTWAFGSGSTSGSGSATTTSTTTFGSGSDNNVDSSSFQLFGSQGSTTFTTSPAFSQPPPPSSAQFQEVSVKTGEEQERVVFGGDATLFEFADGSWKERGKGEMKVNVPEEKTSKPRLVMRSKGNYKLLLNAGLFADMKLASMDSRGVTFACVNSAVEGKSGLTTYAVKFRDSTSAGSFRDAVETHKSGSQPQVPKAPENSPRAPHESS